MLSAVLIVSVQEKRDVGTQIDDFHKLARQFVLFRFSAINIGTFVVALLLLRVASKLTILDVVSMLSTLTAAVLLASPLRNVRDITQLSLDAQHLGALMVWTIGAGWPR